MQTPLAKFIVPDYHNAASFLIVKLLNPNQSSYESILCVLDPYTTQSPDKANILKQILSELPGYTFVCFEEYYFEAAIDLRDTNNLQSPLTLFNFEK